jgi:diadenosine tetraphosphate (Ap4A) HIT family hydrolase
VRNRAKEIIMIEIPEDHILYQSKSWVVNHRVDVVYPGYLILTGNRNAKSLNEYKKENLNNLGIILAFCEKMLASEIGVKICRYGFTKGIPFHFHIVPIYNWLEQKIKHHQKYKDIFNDVDEELDGADYMFFISREYYQHGGKIPYNQAKKKDMILKMKKLFRDYNEL